ncbi:RNA polymerase sigma factor [Mucilaginibacter myungsuensis]|uniref:Sigma-70 family RNA polymerase sigma factor n=1 Tax=Mucilaginibacter myungsuensis TaxID=649104 RepID=A0A929KX20_9SPHI|nr:sigma-70 family RNA polymerase sigma factor [Mucilaginibacter myungsuensis]MBE9662035.1 sigma-70 family RNA polymerase sigma factor [Mucilaginibacter myungsuensis]MDN3599532.1 sigma-70 family RNA polymerase sigma factor [Mucilaginibacter myungsuensis]
MKILITDAHIAACKKGDRRAQETVYRHYAGRMLALCRRYTNNTAEAEDILQDAFVKVFTKIHLYTGEGSFEGWMRRIMVNTALTAYREKQKQVMTVDIDDCLYALNSYTDYQTDDTAYLYDSLNKLPLHHKVAFNLFAIEGYSHQEIAELTNITVLQSRTHVCRARTALRKSVSLNVRIPLKAMAMTA